MIVTYLEDGGDDVQARGELRQCGGYGGMSFVRRAANARYAHGVGKYFNIIYYTRVCTKDESISIKNI